MAFIPPVPAMRRNLIIRKLKVANATDEDTAVTFAEAGDKKVFTNGTFCDII